MYPLDFVYLFIIAVAAFFIYARLRPGAVDPRVFRSRRDRMIGGVFGGLGRRLGVAPLWLRLAWCAAFFVLEPVRFQFMGAYVVLWAITPREPERTTINGRVVPGRPGSAQGATGPAYTSSPGIAAWRLQRRDPTLPW